MSTRAVGESVRHAGRRDTRLTGFSAAVVLALVAGGAIVWLERTFSPGHPAVIVAAAAALPATVLALARPRLVLLTYLFLLPLMMPTALVGGFNGGELLTVGLLAFGGIGLWYERGRIRRALTALGPLLLPLAGFAVVSVASSLVNGVDTVAGIVAAVFKVVAFGTVTVLVYVHADTRSSTLSLLRALLLGGVAVAIYSIVSYLAGWSYSAAYDYDRAAGTFSTWNHLGGFMALVSVPTLALAVMTRRAWVRAALFLAFVAEIIALLLSLTLGSVLALVIAALTAGLFLFRLDWRRLAAAGLLALVGFATVWLTNPLLRDKFSRLDERVIDRLRTYQVGLSMFRDQFWFGFGSPERVESILLLSGRYGRTSLGATSTVPHNSLLLMGVEKGVFGLILFTLLVAASFWLIVRVRKAFEGSPTAILYQGLVIGALAFLVQSMTNNLIVHARLGILYFALVALTVRLAETEPGPEPAADGGGTAPGARASPAAAPAGP